jgi:hypothetical protein
MFHKQGEYFKKSLGGEKYEGIYPEGPREKPGHVDDVPMLLTVLEDIRDLSEGLENCVRLFKKTGD